MSYTIRVPRRVVVRGLLRHLIRGLFPLLTRSSLAGLERFPKSGPLIMIGNHTGAMEVVLLGTYSPRAVEFMGAVEIPWTGWMGKVIDAYGLIPVHRGYTSKETMKMGVDVLRQGGVLGLFPEGGFWEPGRQKAQTGAAWLSYLTGAPVLPIGFGDTRGKMAQIFRLQRPVLEMNVGELLPPVRLDGSLNKKEALQRAADELMQAVWALVPEDERRRKESRPENERFTFRIELFDRAGAGVPVPYELAIADGSWISRFAHRPNLIDSIRDYTSVPVQVFKELERRPPAEEILASTRALLEYIEKENPQYFNYRYGYADGQAFLDSFRQLRDLLQWAVEKGCRVEAEACYAYTDPQTGETHLRRVPEEIEQW
jgi:1-acyl-sn-glycerol-3-phosphate acyltransferase